MATTESRTPFRTNLVSLRTALIFGAGFALALLLTRTLPGDSLFHPDAQWHQVDTVITYVGQPEEDCRYPRPRDPACSIQFASRPPNLGWDADFELWDPSILDAVRSGAPGEVRVPARITYVISEGRPLLVSIEQPD